MLLRGISKHGKDVINNHGNEWDIVGVGKPSCKDGTAWLISNNVLDEKWDSKFDLRWLKMVNDEDFEVIDE